MLMPRIPLHRSLETYWALREQEYRMAAREERRSITTLEDWRRYRDQLLQTYRNAFPADMLEKRPPGKIRLVSKHVFPGFRVENVLFESFPGWFVNATVYLPEREGRYPGVVCPTGHSSKTFPNYVISNQVLARNGFITVSFDPPGMQGEHQGHNDHFDDGALGFLAGSWSNAFFIRDALRCLDYLESREDVDSEAGFGITGVSGGGHTALGAALLDDRIACLAPVCCFSDYQTLLFRDFYTVCPETMGFGFLKYSLDHGTLLEMNAPKPCLVVSGGRDEVLDWRLAQRTVEKARKAYRYYRQENGLHHMVEHAAGHEYTASMAGAVSAFFHQHLKGSNQTDLSPFSMEDMVLPDPEHLLCRPEDTCSLRSHAADILRKNKAVPSRETLSEVFHVREETLLPRDGKGWIRWAHSVTPRTYHMEDGYRIPALVLERVPEPSEDCLVFCDDEGKWSGLLNGGFLAKTAGFLSRRPVPGEKTVISVDLSGFGELEPRPAAYDLATWNRKSRTLAYAALFLGDSLLGKQIREFYHLLTHFLASSGGKRLHAGGRGRASIAALVSSFLLGKTESTFLVDLPVSFASIAEHSPNRYIPDLVFHYAPGAFEIRELVTLLPGAVLVNPRMGNGEIADADLCASLFPNARILFGEGKDIPLI